MQDTPPVPVEQAEATVQALRDKVKRMRQTAEDKTAEGEGPRAPAKASSAAKPKRKASVEEPKPRKKTSRKKPAIDLTDEQMARLRKMAPGSRQKLLNTLAHLKVPDAEATAVALIAHKVIEILPDNHVNWLAP